MLGCVPTGLANFHGGVSNLAFAEELDWAAGFDLSQPTQSRSTSRSVTTVSESGHAIDWNQTSTPAQDASAGNQKIPAMLPTDSVQSVLGIRGGQSTFSNAAPVGTSLQLLPPRLEESIQEAPATAQVIAETTPTPRISAPAPARMVTRDNAQILGFRKTWQPSVPQFEPSVPEFVLTRPETTRGTQEPTAQLNAPFVGNGLAPNVMRDGLNAPSVESAAGVPSFPVGDRRYFPSFMEPRTGAPSNAPENRQPLRDPAPETVTVAPNRAEAVRGPLPNELKLDSPPTGSVIGSGIPTNTTPANATPRNDTRLLAPPSQPIPPSQSTLAPVDSMPDFDELEELLPDGAEVSLSPAESVAPDELEELASPRGKLDSPASIQSRQADDDGSNEGTGSEESSEDDSEIEMPGALTMETLLEEASEIGSSTDPIDDDVDNDSFDETKRPLLSTMDIKPLKIVDEGDSENDLQKLESTDREIDLKKVNEDIEPLPVGRLSQLDATGRLKSHDEPTALESISPMVARLKSPVLRTLQNFHARTEHADSRSNWGMMHQIMVYGADTRIIARGRNYSAIAWMAGNNVCRGSRLMTSANGKIQVREGTGLQGHQAQFLAVMSLVGVPSTYPLYVGSQRYNIKDLVEVEAAACEDGKELTFTLIGLAHYLDTDTTWAGVGNEAWDFERLIAAELSQPIVGAACGGTHRLMAFAHALRKRRLEGQPISGQWKRAEDFLDDFVTYTYSLQNRDGSMSTDWFESPQDNGDLKRKVQTTGHMVEFLLTHLPDEDLGDARMTRAITFLVNAMGRIEIDDSAVGYRGHALRSLAMYHRRMYGIAADYPAPSLAKQTTRRPVRRQR